ncbi:hypothetical protein BGZ60DRAFT_532005 [Tricladium varicosporioides]|nr:hypothetical protein BGZ60DRAFT_532005 [Hymenoscyphus varicosporioides]
MAKRVDFSQVAKECGIVTKGAAAKRYERMMRAHGIASNAANTKPATASRATRNDRRPSITTSAVSPNSKPSSGLSSAAALAAAKKRKIDEFDKANFPCDDDEDFPYTLPSNQIHIRNAGVKLEEENKDLKKVKVEGGQNYEVEQPQPQPMSISAAKNLLRYYTSPSVSPPVEESSSSLNNYTNSTKNTASMHDTDRSSYEFGSHFGGISNEYHTQVPTRTQDFMSGTNPGPECSSTSALCNGFSNGMGSSPNPTNSVGMGCIKVESSILKWDGNLGTGYDTHYQSYAGREGESSGSGLPDSPVIVE